VFVEGGRLCHGTMASPSLCHASHQPADASTPTVAMSMQTYFCCRIETRVSLTNSSLHVLNAPLVCHVCYRFSLRQFCEVLFFETSRSVDTIPSVTRSNTEAVGWWFWTSVNRFTCKRIG